MVVHGGGFILLLFIGVMAAGLRGGCFWEVYNEESISEDIRDIWFSYITYFLLYFLTNSLH